MGVLAGRGPAALATTLPVDDALYAVKGSDAMAVIRSFGKGMSLVVTSNTAWLVLVLAGVLVVSGIEFELQPTISAREIYRRNRIMDGYMAFPL